MNTKEQKLSALFMKKKADADKLIVEIDAALEMDVLSNPDWIDVVDRKVTELAVLELTIQHLSFVLLREAAAGPLDTQVQTPLPPPPPQDRTIREDELPPNPKK